MRELITTNYSEYFDKAVDLGNNSFKIADMKKKIKKKLFERKFV